MNNIKNIPKSKECGIYMLFNISKNKVYIGQTRNFYKRSREHLSRLENGTHYNKELQKNFNEGDLISFAIIEKMDKESTNDEMILCENYYILAFRDKGYKTYNNDTNERILNSMYFKYIYPNINEKQEAIHKTFGCWIGEIRRCKKETLIRKFAQDSI